MSGNKDTHSCLFFVSSSFVHVNTKYLFRYENEYIIVSDASFRRKMASENKCNMTAQFFSPLYTLQCFAFSRWITCCCWCPRFGRECWKSKTILYILVSIKYSILCYVVTLKNVGYCLSSTWGNFRWHDNKFLMLQFEFCKLLCLVVVTKIKEKRFYYVFQTTCYIWWSLR